MCASEIHAKEIEQKKSGCVQDLRLLHYIASLNIPVVVHIARNEVQAELAKDVGRHEQDHEWFHPEKLVLQPAWVLISQ